MFVLGKLLLDGKRHNWATNTFYWKYEPHEVRTFSYFLQASEEDKSDNDNDFEPPIVGEQFQIVLNKLNEKIRIFQDPLNFFQFYLIYFSTHGISFSEMYARELIFEVSRYLILIVMWIQPISSFTELVN